MCTLGERRRTLSKSLFYFENRLLNEQYVRRCRAYDSRLDKELLPEELDIDPVRNKTTTNDRIILVYGLA